MTSIDYYNTNVEKYIKATSSVDMSNILYDFEDYLPPGAAILDAGCGSGRDSRKFMIDGFDVRAFDGSEKMVAHCRKFMGDRVVQADFSQYESDIQFNGIWACASLLHVPRSELAPTINRLAGFLKNKGVFYMSFKEKETDEEKDGRLFTNFTEAGFRAFARELDGLELLELFRTRDVRPDRQDETWINAIFRKA